MPVYTLDFASPKLYCLVTEAYRCEQLAQGCYSAGARTHDHWVTILMPWPPDCRIFTHRKILSGGDETDLIRGCTDKQPTTRNVIMCMHKITTSVTICTDGWKWNIFIPWLWTMSYALTSKYDLHRAKVNQHARYLGQRYKTEIVHTHTNSTLIAVHGLWRLNTPDEIWIINDKVMRWDGISLSSISAPRDYYTVL